MMSININKSIIFSLLMMCIILIAQAQSLSINSTDESENRAFKTAPVEARTFGAIKRFQSALLPIMYKLGVMSAVIFMTLLLAFKSVIITKLILILNLIFFAIKFGALLKSDHGHHLVAHSSWSPPVSNGWSPHKDVHLHIHNGHGKPEYTIPYSTLSGGWDSQSHATGVDSTWSAANSYGTGRGFGSSSSSEGGVVNNDDLTPYGSTQHSTIRDELNSIKSKTINKRNDRQPMIVMAQTNPAASPYNYIHTQNRK